MKSIERLIEALHYSEEEECEWWEVFDSKQEAMNIVKKALKEEVEDHEIVCFASIVDIELFDPYAPSSLQRFFKRLIKELIKDDESSN